MSQRTLKVGEKLFEEGDQSKGAYFIKKGMIRIYKRKGESTIEIETLRAGQLIGELAFLDNQPRSASAEAIIDSDIVEISQSILDETLSKTPEWLKVLLKTIASRLRNATNKIRILESATTEYETDKWGNRSREFVYLTKSELLRFSTSLLMTAARYGAHDANGGLKFSINTLERHCSQLLQVNEGKVAHLIELFKVANLIKNGPENDPKPTLFLSDIDFLDKFLWFVNDQNIVEVSKQRSLSERGFMLLSLAVKHLSKAAAGKDGSLNLNMALIINSEGKTFCNPPLRADELQELMDQKFVTAITVASGEEVVINFSRDKLMFEFRVFWVLNELEKLNERKRKAK